MRRGEGETVGLSPALLGQAPGPFSLSARAHRSVNNKNKQRGLRLRDALTTTDEQRDARGILRGFRSFVHSALSLSLSPPTPTDSGERARYPKIRRRARRAGAETKRRRRNRRVRGRLPPLPAGSDRGATEHARHISAGEGRSTLRVKLKLPHACNYSFILDKIRNGITMAMESVKSTMNMCSR